ncbi:MAG: methionyl-tRNA formyltransferase [Pirellulaceae bacterium]
MRIIVMGTGPFAVPSAQALVADGHEIPLVVTRPLANPAAKKLPPRPLFDWAQARGDKVFEPPSINAPEAIEVVKSQHADLLFVCDYGQILSKACLGAARLGGINLHGSILPRHRGAAPVQWSILRGDNLAGVTVIHMTPGLDAGPALAIEQRQIKPDETAEELEPRLAQAGVDAVRTAIVQLESWDGVSALGEIQDKTLVTKAPRFCKADGALDFRLSADYLVRLVRACQPWPGTFAELKWASGKHMRLIIHAARSVHTMPPNLRNSPPGTVIAVEAIDLPDAVDWQPPWRQLLAVATGQGAFLVSRIQPAGKRAMDAAEFLRGHPLDDSTRFSLPDPPVSPLCE